MAMIPPKIYHAGTLTYTKAALVMLFFWLIWGDFCYTVMEAVTGPIMQLKFKALGASNTGMALLLGTMAFRKNRTQPKGEIMVS